MAAASLNICMVMSTPFPPEEGIGNHVLNISRKLKDRGHNITIITRGSPNKTTKQEIGGIEIIRACFIPIYPIHVWLHGIFVERQIKKLVPEPDIIHIHTPLSPPINGSLPLVSTVHSSLIEDVCHFEVMDARSLAIRLQTRSMGHYLISELIKKSDVVTTVSEPVSRELKKYYKINHEPVVIGNGVDEKTFVPPPRSEKERDYVLCVGRLSYAKGLFDLLDCARILARNNLSFIVVGKGELEKKLKEETRLAQLNDKITFMGQVDHKKLVRLYQNALALIIPSRYESGPLVLLEAMACGTPVITTRVGIVSDVIENWRNGIIIPSKSPEKMAEAISVLSEDDALRRVLGANARKTILERHTWNSVVDRVEDCYHLLCDQR